MRVLVLMFLLVPLVEIYFLIKLGGAVGVGPTILLVVFTALLGAVLVRAQGFVTLVRMQAQLVAGHLPAVEMLEGVLLFVAGALLLTPGFFTDAVGFALLVPRLRRRLIGHALGRGLFGLATPGRPRRGRIIEVSDDSD